MFNPLLDGYRQKRKELLRTACTIQTAVALIFAVGYAILNERIAPYLGTAGILLTLLNLPTIATYVDRKLERYATTDWRSSNRRWDFSGSWRYVATYRLQILGEMDYATRKQLEEHYAKPETGTVTIEQTVFTFALRQGQGTAGNDASFEWQSIAADYDSLTEGFINTFRNTACFPAHIACSAGLEGVEHVRVTDRDLLGRPIKLSSHYSSCMLYDTHHMPFCYTATARYERVPSSADAKSAQPG
jgi:hypothetical protein